MNRFHPLFRVATIPGVATDAARASFFGLLDADLRSVLVLPPGATFTTIVPEPGGHRTFRARTSLGLVPVPIGCAP